MLALQASNLQGSFMYTPQGPPAVYFSVLAFLVIVIAAMPVFLPLFGIPALDLCPIFRRT